jgi:hypothetical protein
LRTVAKPNDRIWLTQGLATAALTDSYLRDQYYAPPKWSKFDDIRSCQDEKCFFSRFDYMLTFSGADQVPSGFEVLKNYSTIAILRRAPNSTQQPDDPRNTRRRVTFHAMARPNNGTMPRN